MKRTHTRTKATRQSTPLIVLATALVMVLAGCAGSTGGSDTAANEDQGRVDPTADMDARAHGAEQPDVMPVQRHTDSAPMVDARATGVPAHRSAPPEIERSLGEPSRAAAAERDSAPAHRPSMNLPAGTTFEAEIVGNLASHTSAVGDRVMARVTTDVLDGNAVAIPLGSTLIGAVAEANAADRFGGISSLALRFDTVELSGGRTVPVHASFRAELRGEKKKDAATIGGAAAGGAILGRILKDDDRSEGMKQGALAGAAIGTAVAAATKGKDVEMPPGTLIEVALDEPATF